MRAALVIPLFILFVAGIIIDNVSHPLTFMPVEIDGPILWGTASIYIVIVSLGYLGCIYKDGLRYKGDNEETVGFFAHFGASALMFVIRDLIVPMILVSVFLYYY